MESWDHWGQIFMIAVKFSRVPVKLPFPINFLGHAAISSLNSDSFPLAWYTVQSNRVLRMAFVGCQEGGRVMHCALLCIFVTLCSLLVGSQCASFDDFFYPSWAVDHVMSQGELLQLKLDNISGIYIYSIFYPISMLLLLIVRLLLTSSQVSLRLLCFQVQDLLRRAHTSSEKRMCRSNSFPGTLLALLLHSM